MTLLAAHTVSKCYGTGGVFSQRKTKIVLREIELAVDDGECLGLLGASGSGKSTLGRLLAGLEAPDGGTVCFRGQPIADLAGPAYRTFRRSVQVVFQDSIGAVNPRHRIRRIVGEPLVNFDGLAGADLDQRVHALLEKVGIDPAEADKFPGQMSGGQLQRVCIARALAPDPALIILDEAVSNLDLTLQIAVLDLLADLRRRTGTAFLFVTHDLRLVRRFCDRVAVLDGGCVVEDRRVTPDLSFDHPAAKVLQRAVLPATPSRRLAAAVQAGEPLSHASAGAGAAAAYL